MAQFTRGNHAFSITSTESCMIYAVTLAVGAEIRHGGKTTTIEIPIFEITHGDHVWNTLVGDAERDDVLNLAPCVPYLEHCAEEFCRTHPDPLRFGSARKAGQFSAKVMCRPGSLRGSDNAMPYPGTGFSKSTALQSRAVRVYTEPHFQVEFATTLLKPEPCI